MALQVQCQYCTFNTTESSLFVKHLRNYHPQLELVQCPVCRSSKFLKIKYILSHMKNCHLSHDNLSMDDFVQLDNFSETDTFADSNTMQNCINDSPSDVCDLGSNFIFWGP